LCIACLFLHIRRCRRSFRLCAFGVASRVRVAPPRGAARLRKAALMRNVANLVPDSRLSERKASRVADELEAASPSIAPRRFDEDECPAHDRRWPLPLRLGFIAGISTILWGLIIFAATSV